MKGFKNYLLIVLLCCLPFIPIFLTKDLPHTHDGLVHLPRMGAYYKALADGQFPVRWAGDLNYGYGMPLFIFIYHVPYLLSSLFIFLGLSLVTTFKLVLFISYLLSGAFMFGFSRTFFKDERKALLVTIFYQFATFRFVELLIRGSFGEVFTYTFLPLVLFGLTILFEKKNIKSFAITAVGVLLLVLSHNAVSLLFFVVCVGFVLFFANSWRNIWYGFTSLLTGLLLSAFYWIPAIFEHQYTYGDLLMSKLYQNHFPQFYKFITPNFLNSSRLQIEGISVQFGLFQSVGVVLCVFVLLFGGKDKKQPKREMVFTLLLLSIALFFMQPISNFFWKNISLLRQFQFPWRFLSIIVFATAFLAGSVMSFINFNKKWVFWGIIFLTILSSVFYWKPVEGYDIVDEQYYWNFPLNTTYYGETDVIWSTGPAKSYPKKRVEIIGGQGEISNFKKKSNKHTFHLKAETKVQIVDHTQYFPGWRVLVNGKNTLIEFQDNNWRGQITFYVPKGEHEIEVRFGESKIRFIADIVSLVTLLLLVLVSLFKSHLFMLNKRLLKIRL